MGNDRQICHPVRQPADCDGEDAEHITRGAVGQSRGVASERREAERAGDEREAEGIAADVITHLYGLGLLFCRSLICCTRSLEKKRTSNMRDESGWIDSRPSMTVPS